MTRKWLRRFSSLAAVAALFAMGLGQASSQTVSDLQDETIVIGIHNGAPWGFRGENGKAAGFHPDLVRAAFEPLGVKQIDFVIADFGALIPGLVAQRFDMIASGLYITPERCKVVAFAEPDLSLKDAVLVEKGNPLNIHSYKDVIANPKIRLGGTRGGANVKNAAEAGVPENQISLFQNTEATVSALRAGRVDAIAFSAPTAITIANDPKVGGIERASPFTGWVLESGREKSGYSAIAFRKEDKELLDLFNKRLAEMKSDGSLTQIMTKNGFSTSEQAPSLTTEQICGGQS